MRFVDPPTLDSPWRERPGDDLDGLLTAYFHHELPRPWPAAPEVEEADNRLRSAAPRRRPVWSSRLALAASVALLLAGGWMLSGSFPNGEKDGPASRMTDPTANSTDGKPFKLKTSLQQQSSGEIGVQIDVTLPEDGKDREIEKNIRGNLGLPPE
jgi:hypothetical protein